MVTQRVIGCFAISLLFVSGIFIASEFTQKKVKKGPSIGALKERCCEQFADIVKLTPPLLTRVAQFQEKAIAAIEGYWQSDKESWCSQTSKEKLAVCNEHMKDLQEKTTALITQYERVMKELRVT